MSNKIILEVTHLAMGIKCIHGNTDNVTPDMIRQTLIDAINNIPDEGMLAGLRADTSQSASQSGPPKQVMSPDEEKEFVEKLSTLTSKVILGEIAPTIAVGMFDQYEAQYQDKEGAEDILRATSNIIKHHSN